jgi:hypothetical protein
MAVKPDVPTRFAADLIESAAVEGARESRSAKQQLDHWARVGRSVSMHETAARRRVEGVLAGSLPMSVLGAEERGVVNAELDVSIEVTAESFAFGPRLAREGITTVALDEDGVLVQHHPDGTSTPLR